MRRPTRAGAQRAHKVKNKASARERTKPTLAHKAYRDVRPLHAHTVVHVHGHLLCTQAQHATRLQKLSEQAHKPNAQSPTHKARRTRATHKPAHKARTHKPAHKAELCVHNRFFFHTIQ